MKKQFQEGLTTIELLVAMVMMSVLFMAVYQVFDTSLDTSVQASTYAELDTETQKVQQLMINRIKEADRFVPVSDVVFADTQTTGSTAYLPSSTLPANQILVFRVPSKNSSQLCDLYAYYVVPSTQIAANSLPVERRLHRATTGAISLIEGKTATSYTCTGGYPTISQLRLLHPSLATDGFAVNAYNVGVVQKGVIFNMRAMKQAGQRSIFSNRYEVKVLARNL